MALTARTRTSLVEWGLASRPRQGETVSGDAAVLVEAADGVLVAVVDALGHGPKAAETANAAAAELETFARGLGVDLLARCHERLRRTRGAAIGIARFSGATATLSWIGVGNVDGRLVRAGSGPPPHTEELLVVSGLVGEELPETTETSLLVRRGDVLVVATDGIDPRFGDWIDVAGPPQRIAERILSEHAYDRDDALVAVARFLEGPR